MREKLRKAELAVARVESGALVALIAIMVTLAFAQVVLRRFNIGLVWAETLLKNLVVWSGFLGAGLAARHEKHFAWEAANVGFPAAWRRPLKMTSSLAGAAVSILLASAAWRYVADDRAAGSVLLAIGDVVVPSWFASAGIPVGFILVAFHLLMRMTDGPEEAPV